MPDARLGHPEVEQQRRSVARRRRFGERATQEDRLRLGSTMLSGLTGGRNQPLDDPAVVGGLAGQQVLGDARLGARLLGEQLGGAAVALRALCGGELRVDAVADDRMHERQRPAGLEDARGRQQIGCLGCLELFEARKSRRLQQVALLEDRERPREPACMLGQPKKPEANRATDASYIASDASLAQRRRELAHEERPPPRHAQAGVDDVRIRSPAEPCLEELGDGGSRSEARDGSPQRRNRSSPS